MPSPCCSLKTLTLSPADTWNSLAAPDNWYHNGQIVHICHICNENATHIPLVIGFLEIWASPEFSCFALLTCSLGLVLSSSVPFLCPINSSTFPSLMQQRKGSSLQTVPIPCSTFYHAMDAFSVCHCFSTKTPLLIAWLLSLSVYCSCSCCFLLFCVTVTATLTLKSLCSATSSVKYIPEASIAPSQISLGSESLSEIASNTFYGYHLIFLNGVVCFFHL